MHCGSRQFGSSRLWKPDSCWFKKRKKKKTLFKCSSSMSLDFAWDTTAPVPTSGDWAASLFEHRYVQSLSATLSTDDKVFQGGFCHTPIPLWHMSLNPSVHRLSTYLINFFILNNLPSLHSPEVLCLYLHIYVNACSIIPTPYVYNVCGCFWVREETLVKSSWA